MFKSPAKKRAHEEFMARQTYKSKSQKRSDFRSRIVHNDAESAKAIAASTVMITVCSPHMPKGTFAGTVTYNGKTTKTFLPRSDLNAKKAKSVADPCQSWIAHW